MKRTRTIKKEHGKKRTAKAEKDNDKWTEKRKLRELQCGPPEIAKLVNNSNNHDLW